MKRLISFLVFVLGLVSASSLLHAQHGAARSGVYPSDYHMKTFTGRLMDFNPATHDVKLVCDICADQEIFSAILGDPRASKTPRFMVSAQDANKRRIDGYKRKPAPDTIMVGDVLRVYYNERTEKRDHEKLKYNAVFEMEKLVEAAPVKNTAENEQLPNPDPER
ncbi:MAG TPA: hypothetical protein VGC88_07800 [Terriglobales bacterium]